MGVVVWYGRSIFASMLMHFVNNGVVVLILWQPEVRRFLLNGERPATLPLLVAPVLLGIGLWLLPRRSAAPADPAALPAQ